MFWPHLSCLGVVLALALSPVRADDNSSACALASAGLPATRVTVSSVTDGDTLVLGDGRRLRLIGINTPEIGHGGNASEPFAREAAAAVRAFVDDGGAMRIVVDREERDNHGRVLAHLFNGRGDNLEALLLSRGLGWHVAVPPNLTLAECLAVAESAARSIDLGVWRLPAVDATALTGGGFQRVRGRVANVSFARAWWLNLEGRLSAVIYPEHQFRFSRDWLQSLEGREIELQGWVYPAHGRPGQWRMKLETRYGIEAGEASAD